MLIESVEDEPKKENYEDFLAKLKCGLKILGEEKISLMIYGSYVRGNADFGRSDIDGVLVFPEDVKIDKRKFMQVSKILANAQIGNNIPLDLTPVDLRTMSDGRFASYDSSFKKYFNLEDECKIVYGPDYRNDFKFEFPAMGDQEQLTANLWKSRKMLLLSEYHKRNDPKRFKDDFKDALDKASRGSKQIIGLTDGNLRLSRFSALEDISKTFPQIDVEPLKRIKHLYKNRQELYDIYKNPEEALKVWSESLTFFEEMIKAYLDANPRTK